MKSEPSRVPPPPTTEKKKKALKPTADLPSAELLLVSHQAMLHCTRQEPPSVSGAFVWPVSTTPCRQGRNSTQSAARSTEQKIPRFLGGKRKEMLTASSDLTYQTKSHSTLHYVLMFICKFWARSPELQMQRLKYSYLLDFKRHCLRFLLLFLIFVHLFIKLK